MNLDDLTECFSKAVATSLIIMAVITGIYFVFEILR